MSCKFFFLDAGAFFLAIGFFLGAGFEGGSLGSALEGRGWESAFDCFFSLGFFFSG